MLGRVGPDTLELTEVNRFRNGAGPAARRPLLGRAGAVPGHPGRPARGRCGRQARLAGLAIDSWGVDYGLLDAHGGLRGNPRCYRDERTKRVVEKVHQQVDPARLYAVNGLQFMPINTVYQLAAEPDLQHVRRALMIPGPARLLADGRGGRRGDQRLHHRPASTPAPVAGRRSCVEALGLPAGLLPEIIDAGQPLARCVSRVGAGLDRVRIGRRCVTTVGSHDTASAVVGVPAVGRGLRLRLLRHLGLWSASSWTRRC